MATCVPIKDLRDTSAFDELVEKSPTPITVTKNGYDRFVCVRSDDFDRMQRSVAEAKLIARMQIAEHERENHLERDAFEALEELRRRYDI
jgi:PHD/YefM family antitoxin component YafN of YafNO toxin-antitoxin module